MFLTSLMQKIKTFAKDENGASGIEYAIIAAMVAVVIVGYMGDISVSVEDIFEKIKTGLSSASTETP